MTSNAFYGDLVALVLAGKGYVVLKVVNSTVATAVKDSVIEWTPRTAAALGWQKRVTIWSRLRLFGSEVSEAISSISWIAVRDWASLRLDQSLWLCYAAGREIFQPKRILCAVALYGAYRYGSRLSVVLLGPDYGTRILTSASQPFIKKVCPDIRTKFNTEFVLPEVKPKSRHSHPNAAAERAAAHDAIRAFVHSTGLDLYEISKSSRADSEGYQQMYSPRDALYVPDNTPVRENHFLVFVDSDYYVDLSYWLSFARPVIMYSFCPISVAGATSDATWTVEDGMIRYKVEGGGDYKHLVWDYESDRITVKHWWGACVYTVAATEHADGHRVVLITPETKITGPIGWMCAWWWGEPGLKLRNYQAGGCIENRYRKKVGEKIREFASISVEGLTVSVDLEVHVLQDLLCMLAHDENSFTRILFSLGKTVPRFMLYNVSQTLSKSGWKDNGQGLTADTAARHLLNWLPRYKHARKCVRTCYYRVEKARPHNYVVVSGGQDLTCEEIKLVGVETAPPLASKPDLVAASCLLNEKAGINKRLVEPQQGKSFSKTMIDWAQEFVQLVVPSELAHTGAPVSTEEVERRQNRPTQRALADQVQAEMPFATGTTVDLFVKQEPMAGARSPRMIANVNTEHKIVLSRYTYAFKEAITKMWWWSCPGAEPERIVQNLVTLATNCKVLAEGDYSNYDGSQTVDMQKYVVKACMMRWVESSHREELARLLNQELNVHCASRRGAKFVTDGQRLSGSPLTTEGNTVLNAFLQYAGFRKLGYKPENAFKQLGLYSGDDGVTPLADESHAQCFVDIASEVGVGLKMQIRQPNDLVMFLGRYYRDLACHHAGSIPDPMRTIRKLHISFPMGGIDAAQALANKCTGILAIDPHVPIISPWCEKAREMSARAGQIDGSAPYVAQCLERGEITTCWPAMTRPMALDTLSKCLNIPIDDVITIDATIRRCNDLEEVRGLVPTETKNNLNAVDLMTGELLEKLEPVVEAQPPTPASDPVVQKKKKRGKKKVTPPSTEDSGRSSPTSQTSG